MSPYFRHRPAQDQHRRPVSCSSYGSGGFPVALLHLECRCPPPGQNDLERKPTYRSAKTRVYMGTDAQQSRSFLILKYNASLTKSPQRRVNAVGSVCSCHDDHMRPLLQPIHEREQLRDDAPLHFSMSLGKRSRRCEPFIRIQPGSVNCGLEPPGP